MPSPDQIIHAKFIIPGTPQTPLENHALVLQSGIIQEILPSQQAQEKYKNIASSHFKTHAILPGFINTHTHLAMNYFRGLADDIALMKWLNDHIWPAEKTWLTHEFVHDASLFSMAEMIRSGTTCFNDMYFYLPATAEAVDISGLRGSIGITVIDFPTGWAKTPDEYLAKGLAFYEDYKQHPRIMTTLAPHAPYTVSDETLLKIKALSEEYNLRINMHVHETADEIEQSLKQYHMRPLKRLQKLGLLSDKFIAIHMTQVNEEDLEIASQSKINIVHCPESNMKLASGICPVTQFQEAKINVSLGTDGAASNNDLDMLGEMRTAALLAKLSTKNPTALSARETISLATVNGAITLGLDKTIGSLEKGKSADFIAINLDEIETLPLFHPASHIVYAASRNQVTDVWVAGKQLLKNRQLLTIDEEELKDKAEFWQKKLESR